MPRICYIVWAALVWLVVATTNAQTLWVLTNNYNDLNPSRDALTMPSGTGRILATLTDGSDPIDVSSATGSSFRLLIVNRVDGYTNQNIAATSTHTDPAGTVRWIIGNLSTGEYELTSEYYSPVDQFRVFWRYLSVGPAACSTCGVDNINVYITNQIFTAGSTNIESQTVNNYGGWTNLVTSGTVTGGVSGSTLYLTGSAAGASADLSSLSNSLASVSNRASISITGVAVGALGGVLVSNYNGLGYVSATNAGGTGSSGNVTSTNGQLLAGYIGYTNVLILPDLRRDLAALTNDQVGLSTYFDNASDFTNWSIVGSNGYTAAWSNGQVLLTSPGTALSRYWALQRSMVGTAYATSSWTAILPFAPGKAQALGEAYECVGLGVTNAAGAYHTFNLEYHRTANPAAYASAFKYADLGSGAIAATLASGSSPIQIAHSIQAIDYIVIRLQYQHVGTGVYSVGYCNGNAEPTWKEICRVNIGGPVDSVGMFAIPFNAQPTPHVVDSFHIGITPP